LPFRQALLLAGMFLTSVAVAAQEAASTPQQMPELSHVSDRTEVSFEESGAYYWLLDLARRIPDSQIRQQAGELVRQRWEQSPRFRAYPLEEFPLFYDLTQEPEVYRGRTVFMRGHLVRLVKYAAGPNDFGIETLYEGWLVTPDSETHPTTVVFTELPEGMPLGEGLIDGVSVAGYFLKLHTYSARDRKTRFAPLVLAETLQWAPPPAVADDGLLQIAIAVSAVLLFAGLLGVVWWLWARQNRRVRRDRFRESVPSTPPDFLNELPS
jgi:hypothetical protein